MTAVALTCFEREVLANFEDRIVANKGVRCVPYRLFRASWKSGSVNLLVNALLSLVDKGLLDRCDGLSFCLTSKGRSIASGMNARYLEKTA